MENHQFGMRTLTEQDILKGACKTRGMKIKVFSASDSNLVLKLISKGLIIPLKDTKLYAAENSGLTKRGDVPYVITNGGKSRLAHITQFPQDSLDREEL